MLSRRLAQLTCLKQSFPCIADSCSGKGRIFVEKDVNSKAGAHTLVSHLRILPPTFADSLSVIMDPTVAILAIVLTGLEEVVMRSTMVKRDTLFRWLQGLPELTEDEEELQRRLWSASVASSM